MRRVTIMLGAAVQLCALPWLGFVPDELDAAPTMAKARWRVCSRGSELAHTSGEVEAEPVTCPEIRSTRNVRIAFRYMASR